MNFVDCHEEKIHIPGHIQEFGYLIGLDAESRVLTLFSQNIADIFPLDQSFFGKKLEAFPQVFGEILSSLIFSNVPLDKLKEAELFLDQIDVNGEMFHFTLYRLGDTIYLEFEKIIEFFPQKNYIAKKYENIHNAVDSTEIWNELLSSVGDAIDYDRMMIYRFLEDGTGKVIAEKLKNDVESFLHLHYPESDIPKQARALYLKNRKRIFSNVHAQPVPIFSNLETPVDLTYSSVRALSPVHAEYIKNSGASSSFSISIIINNKLWGLVTCQNVAPKHIDLVNRIRAEVFTVIAANAYTSYKTSQMLQDNVELDARIGALKAKLQSFDSLEESLFGTVDKMRNFPDADGLAVVVDNQVRTSGVVPQEEDIFKIVKYARENPLENFYASNQFSNSHEDLLGPIKNGAGVMFGFTDDKRNELLIWFRKEIDGQVLWAGNPAKKTEILFTDGVAQTVISPRKSFETYIENIKGKARPWRNKDVFAAKKVVAAILETTYSQFRKVRELNLELKNLNEELDTFSYTISHDLGTPLTVMKLNAQLLARSNKENSDVQKKVSSILDEISGMESMMRGVLQLSRAKSSEISIHPLETEKIIHKICRDAKLTINTATEIEINNLPPVLADEVMLNQVFLNIIGNAVKYSSKSENPKVVIEGKVDKNKVIYTVKDNGIGIPEEAREKMFKIFNRMENATDFQGNGVGLSIVYRIMQRIEGDITYKSKVNEGTTFILTFRKP